MENIEHEIKLDPFERIYQFINTEILSKYNRLTTCHLDREGEENFKEYYIRTDGQLSNETEVELKIIKDVREYCIENDIEKEFDEILILVCRELDD